MRHEHINPVSLSVFTFRGVSLNAIMQVLCRTIQESGHPYGDLVSRVTT